jgi:hypothetical protein
MNNNLSTIQKVVLLTIPEVKELVSETIREELSFLKALQPTPQIKDGTDLITIAELAKLLQRSIVTIHSWKKQGLIPFYRIARKIYFKQSEVLESLQKIERLVK